MKVVSFLLSLVLLFGTAHAATVSVANGDFESPYALTHPDAVNGSWELGAANWTVGGKGAAGTFEPVFGVVYSSVPAGLGDRVGFVNSGSTLWQSLGVQIVADANYTLSTLFGHRLSQSFGATMSFFAGDTSNIIGSVTLSDPGAGAWGTASLFLDSAFLSAFVGQELGIIFNATAGQLNFDNVTVYADLLEDERVLVNPVPGAVWLFGTALAAGFAARRRKKSA